MSVIESLANRLCAEGVPFESLGNLGSFTRGNGLQKSDLTDEGVPAIHYGQIHTYYGTWTDTTTSFTDPGRAARLRRAAPGDLIIATTSEDDAAVAKATAWVGEGEVVVSGDAFIYHHKLEPRFVAHFFQSKQFQDQKRKHITGAKVRRISGDALAGIRIPVPPREVQLVIAQALDDLEDAIKRLTKALSSESDLRRAQLSLSREALLRRSGDVSLNAGVALSEVVQFLNAKPHEKFVTDDGTVELLTARFISTSGRSVRRVLSQNVLTPALCHDVAMVMSDLPNGRALARCFYVDANDKYAANQRVCLLRVLDKSAIFPRYLYHFLDRNPQLLKYDNGQDQTHLKKGEILDVRVPKIEFSEQVHVAATLDRLDSGIGSLQSAIDEESLVRRKQYEYYRDKLLTFEEAPA